MALDQQALNVGLVSEGQNTLSNFLAGAGTERIPDPSQIRAHFPVPTIPEARPLALDDNG